MDNPVDLKMGIDFAGVESIRARSSQEDYSLFRIFKNQLGLLVVLADGMGGHTSGEIASKNAVNAFDRTFHSYPSESTALKLGASLSEANSQLTKLINSNPQLDGMGCTLIGAYIDRVGIHWVSVGDSLLYLYRNRKLIRLNADHSMAPLIEESLRSGKITREEAANYPNKNALRSAVMGNDLPLIDAPAAPKKLFSGDIIVVASDGILSLSDGQIASHLNKFFDTSADNIAKNLLQAVETQRKSNQDNITIQVIKIPNSFGKGFTKNKTGSFLLISFVTLLIAATVLLSSNPTFLTFIGLNHQNKSSDVITPVAIPLTDSQSSEPKQVDIKPATPEPVKKSLPVDPTSEKSNSVKAKEKASKKNDNKSKTIEPKKSDQENNDKGGIGGFKASSDPEEPAKAKKESVIEVNKGKTVQIEEKTTKPTVDVKGKTEPKLDNKKVDSPVVIDKSTPAPSSN